MARQTANIDIATFTFYGWVQKTNELAKLASNTVTVDVTGPGDISTGNGYVIGILGANTLAAEIIKGGNVQSSAAISVISNTNFGNSSVNVLTTRNAIEQIKVDSYTSTNTDLQTLDTFTKTDYRGGKYLISIKDNTNNDYQTTEIMILQDGTTAYVTEYATLISDGTLAPFTSDINTNDVRLRVTPSFANTTFKFQRTLLAV